jgi:hypothetical protein
MLARHAIRKLRVLSPGKRSLIGRSGRVDPRQNSLFCAPKPMDTDFRADAQIGGYRVYPRVSAVTARMLRGSWVSSASP